MRKPFDASVIDHAHRAPTPTDPTAFYTISDLVVRWKCARKTLWNWIKAGELQAFRLGRNFRIPASEVARFEATREP